jgi:hypothetical protein
MAGAVNKVAPAMTTGQRVMSISASRRRPTGKVIWAVLRK